jgi:hypothetical protein
MFALWGGPQKQSYLARVVGKNSFFPNDSPSALVVILTDPEDYLFVAKALAFISN